MRSIRLGRGAKENNAAEKMVVSFKNYSDNVGGRENLQLYVGFQLLHVEGDV